ncbi:MAG TPA: hypothetical protein VGC91_04170 [Pyrinomonadaceae bacterium]|jgi:hypothetical protein
MAIKLQDKKVSATLILFAACLLLNLTLFAQMKKPTQQNQTRQLTAGENALAQSSKAAIIGTGISAPYFEAHFKLERVVDTTGDRRVVWKYSIGEYETMLNDAVGFYTNEKGERINLHAIGNLLSAAHDIKSVIPKQRAGQLMKQCLGEYKPGAILFQAFGTPPRAALLFTASSIPKPRTESREVEREKAERKRAKEKREKAKGRKSSVDVMSEEEEDEDAPPIYTGFLDLETGACTKGVAQVDHPKPVKE